MPEDGAPQGMSLAATAASTTLGWIGTVAVIVLVGLYLAVRPTDYVAGLRALLHPSIDSAAATALNECGTVLRGCFDGALDKLAEAGQIEVQPIAGQGRPGRRARLVERGGKGGL